MHREIQIKQFPIVTTHWWPKTRNERLCVRKRTVFISFFTSCTQPCPSDLSAHTHPVCDVCVRSGSRCIHTGRRHQSLTEGVSEAWCWRAVIVTTTNHILLWCCMNGIGYLHEAIWLADASVGSWKVENFSRVQYPTLASLWDVSNTWWLWSWYEVLWSLIFCPGVCVPFRLNGLAHTTEGWWREK